MPFYCPYCGDEDLRPAEQTERVPHGAWYCASCLRTFAVKMIGIGMPDAAAIDERDDRPAGRGRAGSGAAGPGLRRRSRCCAWAAETFGDRLIVASNMQDAVLVDLVAKAVPGVDVLFLETGYHFAETIGTRDAVAADLRRHDRRRRCPSTPSPSRTRLLGKDLFARDPDQCCALRKVEPLRADPRRLRRLGHRRAPRRGARPAAEHPAGHLGREATAWSRSTRSPRGRDERGAAPTSTSTTVLVNPLRRRGLPVDRLRSRAPARSRPARTPAPAAGPASPRPNADCTHEHCSDRSDRTR